MNALFSLLMHSYFLAVEYVKCASAEREMRQSTIKPKVELFCLRSQVFQASTPLAIIIQNVDSYSYSVTHFITRICIIIHSYTQTYY